MTNIYFEKLNDAVCSYGKPPSPAVMSEFPEWWKNMPRNFDLPKDNVLSKFNSRASSTVRNCPAVNDTMNFGYTIYLPYDVYIEANSNNLTYQTARVDTSILEVYSELDSESNLFGWNDPNILSSFSVPEGYFNISLKWNSMWGVKTDPGYSTWFTHPINRYDLPFLSIDGIIDTDVFPARFPYSFFIKDNFCGVIKAGTPMLQAIPFKRENFVSHIVDADISDIKNQGQILNSRFSGVYKKLFWNRKKFM